MTINKEIVDGFYCSSTFFKHWTKHLVYTEGIHYLVENGGAWLVDAIASYQPSLKKNQRMTEFQLWFLKLDGKGCVLTCQEDSGEIAKIRQEIEYTDFPFDIKLYVENGTLLLPSEH